MPYSKPVKNECLQGCCLPKVGFGTWKIGGTSNADHAGDINSRAALRSALEIGYTHFDTAEMYADGHAEELLGEVLREKGIDRRQLFITTKVTPWHLKYEDVLRSCDDSLRRLGLDFVDLYLIHWSTSQMKLADSFRALNQLVRDGKVKHLGVSNFDLALLKQSQQLSESPILTDQVPYSLQDRSYASNGVLEYCQSNDVFITAYSPFEEGKLRISKELASLAAAHSVTPHEIALAWLCNQHGVITIPMSKNPVHQRQNLEAAEIQLSDAEMSLLG